jgi:hypothetical protein
LSSTNRAGQSPRRRSHEQTGTARLLAGRVRADLGVYCGSVPLTAAGLPRTYSDQTADRPAIPRHQALTDAKRVPRHRDALLANRSPGAGRRARACGAGNPTRSYARPRPVSFDSGLWTTDDAGRRLRTFWICSSSTPRRRSSAMTVSMAAVLSQSALTSAAMPDSMHQFGLRRAYGLRTQGTGLGLNKRIGEMRDPRSPQEDGRSVKVVAGPATTDSNAAPP